MSVVYLLLPISMGLAGLFVLAFRWAARGGQFDDLDGAAVRMLFEPDELATQEGEPPASPGAGHDRRGP